MEKLNIIMLGPNGSGKTIYLAVLHNRSWLPEKDRQWSFALPFEQSQTMNDIYAKIINPQAPFPKYNDMGDYREFGFTCRFEGANGRIPALQLTYLDFPGERIIRTLPGEDPTGEFPRRIRDADALIGLFDGEDILKLMQNEQARASELQTRYGSMFYALQMNERNAPIHFVVSKWDLLADHHYTLKEVKERLLQFDLFERFVGVRRRLQVPTRFIPISSLGPHFARLENGVMKKAGKAEVEPEYVDVPMAVIVCDALSARLADKSNAQRFAEGVRTTLYILEPAVPGPVGALSRLVSVALGRAERQRVDQLRRERKKVYDRLKDVKDESGALEVVVNDLALERATFEYHHPDSLLT